MRAITKRRKTVTTYTGLKLRLPARRTKFSRMKLSEIRPDEEKSKREMQPYVWHDYIREILHHYRTNNPIKIGRFKVYFVKFENNILNQRRVWAWSKSREFLIDEKLRELPVEFLHFILKHEQREGLIKIAGYHRERIRRSKNVIYSRAHAVAMQKEYRDLLRKGKLNKFMSWLKKLWPEAYEERLKAWKLKE